MYDIQAFDINFAVNSIIFLNLKSKNKQKKGSKQKINE